MEPSSVEPEEEREEETRAQLVGPEPVAGPVAGPLATRVAAPAKA